MASDRVTLLDMCSAIVDNRGRTCPVGLEGIPLIATNCVKNESLYPSYDTVRFVSNETYSTWFRGHPHPGDLIFVTKGSPGQVCVAPDPVDFCIAQDMVALRPNPRVVYPPFMLAFLRSSIVSRQIEDMHVGTLIPHFKKGDFNKLHLVLPEKPVQRAAGDLYMLLSTKIELLKSSSGHLESIARAIFKSWFVDFDPVRAKAQGREPEGIDIGTASLFPSEFKASELGLIPREWTVERLGHFIDVTKGKSYKSTDLEESHTTALVTLKSFLRGGGFNVEGFKPYSGGYKPSQVLNDGDIVVAYTDVTQAGEVIGQPAMVTKVVRYDTLVASLDVGIIRTLPERNVPGNFIYGLLDQGRFHDHVSGYTSGTTVLHLAKNAVSDFLAIVPDRLLMDKYESIARPIYERVRNNVRLSQTLSELRDTLLPRLISGKLRVPEAEKLVEAVL